MSGRWLRRALPVILTAAVVAPAAAYAATTYTDVPASSPYSAAVTYLDSAGIVTACKPSKFCPGDGAKRGDVATWLFHMSGNDPSVAPSVNAKTVGGLSPAQLRGQTGPQGPTGPAGVSGYEQVTRMVRHDQVPAFSELIDCPSGKKVISGGIATVGRFYVTSSFPAGEHQWQVSVSTADGTPADFRGEVFAICVIA
jgi:hypothetical protein